MANTHQYIKKSMSAKQRHSKQKVTVSKQSNPLYHLISSEGDVTMATLLDWNYVH